MELITLVSEMSQADRRINEKMLEEARCHTWRLMLLEHEIMELGGVMGTAIDGGVPSAAMDHADELPW